MTRGWIGAAALLAAVASSCTADRAPVIVASSLVEATKDTAGTYDVLAVVRDDREVASVDLVWSVSETSTRTAMVLARDDTYVSSLPGLPPGTTVRWYVEASDDTAHVTRDPEGAPAERFTFTVGNVPSKPELLTLWPAQGPASGGTEVLLVGHDLRAGTIATFGDFQADTLQVLSRTQARVKTRPGRAGVVDVAARNADGGRAVLPQSFTYIASPEVISVSPDHGTTMGGTPVTITGKELEPGASFLFAGAPATGVVIVSRTEARAVTPPGPIGPVTVRVEHPVRGFGEKPNAYRYVPPPVVTRVMPARGSDQGGTEVRVIGMYFEIGAIVRFDDAMAAACRFVSAEELVCITPPHPIGFAEVSVTNPDRQRGALPMGFFFFGPPEVDAVVPPFAAEEGGATVRVTGRNFEAGTTVSFDGRPATCTTVSDTELSCGVPPHAPGPVRVDVTNPDRRSASLRNGLTYFGLRSVTPARGPASGGTRVIVRGLSLPPALDVHFGAAATACRRDSDTELSCVTPPGPPNSFVDVAGLPAVAGQVPTVLEMGYFYVSPPVISQVVPPRGALRGGTRISIRGDFFQLGATVMIGASACLDVVVISATEIQCRTPPGPPGRVIVQVTNPDEQSGTWNGFEYVPVTFTPAAGLVDGFTTMRLSGADFTAGAVVRIGGQTALRTVFRNDSEIVAEVPPAMTTGSVTVEVLHPGQPVETAPSRYSYRVYRDRSTRTMAGAGETSDVMIADLDGDGDRDLIYANGANGADGSPEVLENTGGGTGFRAISLGFSGVHNESGVCDVNGDNLPEIVFSASGSPARYFVNMGGMRFSPGALPGMPSDAFETSFHDVTGDGRCDLINLAIQDPDTVLRNEGGGRFTAIPNALPHEGSFIHDHKIDTGDLDGDGDADMVVVVDDVNYLAPQQRHRVYLNDGRGVFTEDMRNRPVMQTVHGDIYDVRIGDLDLDGDLDVVAPSYNQPPVVLLNDGRGVLSVDTAHISQERSGESALVLDDVDRDGDLDLWLINLNGPPETSRLFLNDGRGFLQRASRGEPPATPASYRGAAGDIDGDGTTDLLLGVVGGANRMYWMLE